MEKATLRWSQPSLRIPQEVVHYIAPRAPQGPTQDPHHYIPGQSFAREDLHSLFSCGCLYVNPNPPLNTTEFAFANGKLTSVPPFSQGKLLLARIDQFFHCSHPRFTRDILSFYVRRDDRSLPSDVESEHCSSTSFPLTSALRTSAK